MSNFEKYMDLMEKSDFYTRKAIEAFHAHALNLQLMWALKAQKCEEEAKNLVAE